MKSMQNSFNSGSIQHEILFENSVTFYDDTMFCFETIPSHEKNEEYVTDFRYISLIRI